MVNQIRIKQKKKVELVLRKRVGKTLVILTSALTILTIECIYGHTIVIRIYLKHY